MAVVLIPAETFWSEFAIALGSVLVLFSLVTTGMPEKWIKWMPALAAICLAVGAALNVGPDVHAYADKHFGQAALAFGVLAVMFLVASFYFIRAVRAEPRESREHKE